MCHSQPRSAVCQGKRPAKPVLVGLEVGARRVAGSVDRYDARIMHRVVPNALYEVEVVLDAGVREIAACFGVCESFVRGFWVTTASAVAFPAVDAEERAHDPVGRGGCTDVRAVSDFALALQKKLQAVVEAEEAAGEQRLFARPELCSATTEQCGFSTCALHPDLVVSRERHLVAKAAPGLYRSLQSAAPLARGESCYVEFHIVQSIADAGVCVGLSTQGLSPTLLIGSDARSVGFHSSGNLVQAGGAVWLPYGKPFSQGDTVALLVKAPVLMSSARDDDPSAAPPSVELYFFVNGFNCGRVDCAALDSAAASEGADIYPAVSLYRQGSRVATRCCPADWQFCSAASIVIAPLRAICQRTVSSSLASSTGSGSGLKPPGNCCPEAETALGPMLSGPGPHDCESHPKSSRQPSRTMPSTISLNSRKSLPLSAPSAHTSVLTP